MDPTQLPTLPDEAFDSENGDRLSEFFEQAQALECEAPPPSPITAAELLAIWRENENA